MTEAIVLVQHLTESMISAISAFNEGHARWRLIAFSDNTVGTKSIPLKHAQGVIACTRKQPTCDILNKSGVPWINIRYPQPGIPSVYCDRQAIGRVAAQHFYDLGFREIKFAGPEDPGVLKGIRSITGQKRIERGPHMGQARLSKKWLKSLTKPAAVLCHSDGHAVELIHHAQESGLRVPDDVAICGINNNLFQVLCAAVPLSSVDPNIPEMASTAARALYNFLEKGKKIPQRMVTAPLGMIARRSTDTFAALDPDVALALKIIKDGLSEGIQLEEVLAQTGLSRSTLERRFQQEMHTSPGAYIQEQRLLLAAKLLIENDWNCGQVAVHCGFNTASYFSRAFQRRFKETPQNWRQKHLE